uniref:Protein kinase domain-containing protein n=1 Tax=Cyprinus carpio TaxID=7962 RepID=A0A8C1MZS5_CYPCA
MFLGFLHDYAINHHEGIRCFGCNDSWRLEHGGRAFTICGTIQYMAPEVLSGGPYNHVADWWSLGILLFALATDKFPVSPEPDHCSISRRLQTVERFKRQTFFHGTPFDSHLLQKTLMELILETEMVWLPILNSYRITKTNSYRFGMT